MNNLQAFQGSREAIRGLSFSPDDQRFVSASDDSVLRVWRFDEAREEAALKGEQKQHVFTGPNLLNTDSLLLCHHRFDGFQDMVGTSEV